MNSSRKYLSTTGLLSIVHQVFKKLKVIHTKGNRIKPITTTDCLMSGMAIFGLKYPSLLKFDTEYDLNEETRHNLKTLYKIEKAPSDTYLRERLDEVDPKEVRKAFKAIFAKVQRGKALESFKFIKDHYLLSVDGTGFFSSHEISCDNCCEKNHNNGDITYYHQMLCGAIVHPDSKVVIPFAPEAILKSDGMTKNDCEFNAMKRFIQDFRREHPHLKIIVLADSLTSHTSGVNLLKANNMSFILGAKPGNHKTLFEFVDGIGDTFEHTDRFGKILKFRYKNAVPLNDVSGISVNFLELTEYDTKTRNTSVYSWVTDIYLSQKTILLVAQGGRTRWKIENEIFNTLKNQGYSFEHNFGHGKKYLSTIFGMLMLLAFLIDQIQELCDPLFQGAMAKLKRKSYLWEKLRVLFCMINLSSWHDLWNVLTHGLSKTFSINTT